MLIALCFMPCALFAAPARVSIFSTSADWEAVTGLRFGQHTIEFEPDDKLVGDGLELYFLDGFPCFGQTDTTNIWIGPRGQSNGRLRLVCLYPPSVVYFAWRNAGRSAPQNATRGILECPNSGHGGVKIELSKCTQGKEWKENK
jgi:hypothetical protein